MPSTAALAVISLPFGLVIGSFLNVVVHRVPAGRSLSRPRSACPGCSEPIAAYDNIPVVSWLVLRGRCRHCRRAISVRYPLVEAGTAALFAGVGLRFGWTWTTPAVDVFVAGLLALACVDLERYLLPRRIVYPMALLSGGLLVVASAASGDWGHLEVGAACAAVAFGVFWALNRANPRWLGFGDVRLAALCGAGLGWIGYPELYLGFMAGFVIGAITGLVVLAVRRSRRFPFAPALAAGTALGVLWGGWLADMWLHPG